MTPGKMDRIISVYEATNTTDAYGSNVVTWVLLCKVWADRRELKGSEKWTAQQIVANISCKYLIRYRDDITPMHRIVDESGREYDIHSVVELGRREGLELTVSARGE